MIDLAPIWTGKVQGYIFRMILNGFSYPGRVQNIEQHIGDSTASEAILPVLLDSTVSLADPDNKLNSTAKEFLNTTICDSATARFILVDGTNEPAFTPPCGTLLSPEKGATVILEIDSVKQGQALQVESEKKGQTLQLSGPGVNGTIDVLLDGLNSAWLNESIRQCKSFPVGVDLIICDQTNFICIPRTTLVEGI